MGNGDESTMFGFCSIGFDATLGDDCGIWEPLHSFRDVKCFAGYSIIFLNGYIKPYGSPH